MISTTMKLLLLVDVILMTFIWPSTGIPRLPKNIPTIPNGATLVTTAEDENPDDDTLVQFGTSETPVLTTEEASEWFGDIEAYPKDDQEDIEFYRRAKRQQQRPGLVKPRDNYTATIARIMEKTEPRIYNKMNRPNKDGQPVDIGVSIAFYDVSELSETRMETIFDVYFRLRWNDDRVAYTDIGRPILLTGDAVHRFWIPDIFFKNARATRYHDVLLRNHYIRVFHDGNVTLSTRVKITISCPMTFELFPFDLQKCFLLFGSYGYTNRDVTIHWHSEKPEDQSDDAAISVNKEIELPEFTILGYKSSKAKTAVAYSLGENEEYQKLRVDIFLKRRFVFYLVNAYTPSSMIVMISWLAFWIPRKATPARVTLGITTVLTETSLVTATNENLPKISYIKALDIYLAFCFVMVFAALLEFTVVSYTETTAEKQMQAKMKKKLRRQNSRLSATTAPAASYDDQVFKDDAESTKVPPSIEQPRPLPLPANSTSHDHQQQQQNQPRRMSRGRQQPPSPLIPASAVQRQNAKNNGTKATANGATPQQRSPAGGATAAAAAIQLRETPATPTRRKLSSDDVDSIPTPNLALSRVVSFGVGAQFDYNTGRYTGPQLMATPSCLSSDDSRRRGVGGATAVAWPDQLGLSDDDDDDQGATNGPESTPTQERDNTERRYASIRKRHDDASGIAEDGSSAARKTVTHESDYGKADDTERYGDSGFDGNSCFRGLDCSPYPTRAEKISRFMFPLTFTIFNLAYWTLFLRASANSFPSDFVLVHR